MCQHVRQNRAGAPCDIVFQMVLSTNQQVVVFTQQPYFNVPRGDPVVTINTSGEISTVLQV